MNHRISANKNVRRKGVTIAAAALSVALVAPFAQSVAYPEITAAARADQGDAALSRDLPENPPVFFANPTRTPRLGDQGVYTVRSTPTLVGNFFPEGTTFELQDPTWTFARARGEDHPEYTGGPTTGWVGFSRNNDGSYGTNPKGSNLQSNAPDNHPFVVPKTGQILFGLGSGAKDGDRIDVPLRAVYVDTKNKRKYVWNFRQGIQVGGLKENERPGKPSDMLDAEFTEFHPVPAKSNEDLQKLKALEKSLGLKFEAGAQGYKGWYQPLEGQTGGRSAGWNTPKNKPVNNINLAHKNNEIFEPKPVNKPVETTAGNIPDPELGIGNKKELPENTKFTWEDPSVFDSPSEGKNAKLKVTYPDGTSEVVDVPVKVTKAADKALQWNPSYKPLTIEPGKNADLEAPTFDKLETENVRESEPAPAGTTFKLGDLPKLPDGLTAKVNGNDGSVELTVGEKVQAGEYKVPVTVTYEDGSEDTAEVSVTVEAKDPEPPALAPVIDDLGYSQDIHVAPDNYKRSDSTGMPNLPETIQKREGDFFRFGDLPEGFVRNPNPSWNGVEEIIREGAGESERILLRLNKQNGKVEVNAEPDADYSIGELPVQYADANGNLKGKDTVSVTVRPIAHSWNGEPTKSADGSVTVPYTGSKPDQTGGLTAKVTNGSGEVALDENGNINYTPGADDKPGSVIEVTVSDSDGNPVRVVDFEIPIKPKWESVNTPEDGSAVTVPNSGDAFPADSEISVNPVVKPSADNKGSDKWVAVRGEDGSITVTPGADAKGGDSVTVDVEVTYPDGSPETESFTVTVPDAREAFTRDNFGEPPLSGDDADRLTVDDVFSHADRFDPQWDEVSAVDEGGSVVIPNSGDALPEDAGVGALITPGEHNKGKDEWDVSYDPATGALTVTPGADAAPGDFVAVDVDVFYDDAEDDEDKSSDSQRIFVQVTGDGAEFVDENLGQAPLDAGEGTWHGVDFSGKHKSDAGEIEGIRGSDDSHSDGDISAEDIFKQADRFDPSYAAIVGAPGETVKVAAPKSSDGSNVPGDSKFESDNPAIKVDPNTGELEIEVPESATPGSAISANIIVTYPDGSTDTIPVSVEISVADFELSVDRINEGEQRITGTTEPNVPVVIKDSEGNIIGQGKSDDEGNFALITNRPVTENESLEITAGNDVQNETASETVAETETATGEPEVLERPEAKISDFLSPKGQEIKAKVGSNPKPEEGIANLDELAGVEKVSFKDPEKEPDTSEPGEREVIIVVTYVDGSTDEVRVTLNVDHAHGDSLVQPDLPTLNLLSEVFEPEIQAIEVGIGETPAVADAITNQDDLPWVKIDWLKVVDTSTAGAKTGVIEVTYSDGTTDTVEVPVNVVEKETTPKPGADSTEGEAFIIENFDELWPLDGNDENDLTAGELFTDAPTVNDVHPGDNIITGTGKPGATITVTGPNGFSTTTTVHENGNWSVDLTGGATPETEFIVSQKDGDKNESDQVLVKVGKENVILPIPGAPGSSELPGSSLGSSNFNIPKHLQCAVFAGGVTAIPLILLSPMHNMYEMMINPHLNGLREQFQRELHALDQQVRRGLGVEGHPALQLMDHINGRVNEFNQQLGQVAHDNRHIGLAAAAIAVAGLSFQHCMNTQAASASSASLVGSSSSAQEQAPVRNEAKEENADGISGWFQGLFNRN